MFLINSSNNYAPNSSKMVMWSSVNFFTIFGTLRDFLHARIQKPFRWLTDRHTHTDGRWDANRMGCWAHIKRIGKGRRALIKCCKGPQGASKALKRAAGCCALPNKPRVSTSWYCRANVSYLSRRVFMFRTRHLSAFIRHITCQVYFDGIIDSWPVFQLRISSLLQSLASCRQIFSLALSVKMSVREYVSDINSEIRFLKKQHRGDIYLSSEEEEEIVGEWHNPRGNQPQILPFTHPSGFVSENLHIEWDIPVETSYYLCQMNCLRKMPNKLMCSTEIRRWTRALLDKVDRSK